MDKALMIVLLVGLVIWLWKITRIVQYLSQHLQSISPVPGWVRIEDERGTILLTGGSIHLETPSGHNGPTFSLHVVPGQEENYTYPLSHNPHYRATVARNAGFDAVFGTATLPDQPPPPHLRLEYRDDGTLTVRTWRAKVETAEWSIGDGY